MFCPSSLLLPRKSQIGEGREIGEDTLLRVPGSWQLRALDTTPTGAVILLRDPAVVRLGRAARRLC